MRKSRTTGGSQTEWLDYFFEELVPKDSFVLFTTNSDISIGPRFASNMNRRNQLVAWFGANIAVHRPNLFAFPLVFGTRTGRTGMGLY